MATSQDIQVFRDLLSKWVDAETAKKAINDAKQPKIQSARQRLMQMEEESFATPTFDETEVAPQETEVVDTEYGFDPWVKLWKWISKLWKAIKTEWKPFSKVRTPEYIWRTAVNVPWDAVEAAWEIIELASDPIWTGIAAKTTWEWLIEKWLNEVFSTKIWQDILRWLWAPEGNLEQIRNKGFFTSENKKLAADAAIKHLEDNFWTMDKATTTISENPVDSALFIKWMLSASKKVIKKWDKKRQQKIDELTKKADENIEQFLKPTKKDTKQITKQITPEIQSRLVSGKLKPWDRESIKAFTDSEVERVWKEIWDYIWAWKVKWEIDFDWMIDVLVKEDAKLRLDWNIIPWNEAKAKFINTQLDFLQQLEQTYKWVIPAAKQLELRQKYDVVFDKTITRDKITKFQDDLQVKLADSLRSELAKNNPDLAKLNQEYTFNKWLQKVLDETLERTTWQDPVWLINELRWATQWTLWAWVWAWVWGAAAWPIWATVWAVIWWVTGAKLKAVVTSPKYKLITAKKKAELADAIAKWETTKIEKILDGLMVTYWIAQVTEGEQ